MTKAIEHNVETGEIIERPLTADEIADIENTKLIVEQAKNDEIAKAQEKVALLQKLGITEDEAKLLLG